MNKNMKKRTFKRAAAMLAAVYFACAALTGCGGVEITKSMAHAPSSEEVITTEPETEILTEPPAVTMATSSAEIVETTTTKASNKKKKKSKNNKKTTTTTKAAEAQAEITTKIPKSTVTTTTTIAPETAAVTETSVPEPTILETTTTTVETTQTQQVTTEITTTTSAEETEPPTETWSSQTPELITGDSSQSSRSHKIDVNCILQNPELPMGCEAVSLTMVFNYFGYNADKMSMATYYMPRADVYYDETNTMHGPDFRYTFAGDPADPKAYGCLAPCMITTAQNYLNDVGGGLSTFDASGSSFEDLLTNYIDNDIPLLLWVTGGLVQPYYSHTWITPSGEQMSWLKYEHCLVLTGYDLDKGIVYVADPLAGNVAYSYDLVKQRYYELGQQSMGLIRW